MPTRRTPARLSPQPFESVRGGLGHVSESTSSLRGLFDARPSNTSFVDPPKVGLLTPEGLARLELSPEAVSLIRGFLSDRRRAPAPPPPPPPEDTARCCLTGETRSPSDANADVRCFGAPACAAARV